MRSFVLIFLFFAVLAAGPTSVVAQSANGNGTATAAAEEPRRASLPFTAGEVLTYEGKLSKFISGISVAELTFSLTDGADPNKLLVNAEAKSKGTLLWLLRFSFLQQIDSTMDRDELFVLATEKHDVQKSRVRNSRADFDYSEKRVTYVESDPNEPMRPPRTIASEISGETYDLVSGIYKLRTLPLEVGKTFELSISDSGLVYQVPVKVTGREEIRTDIGRVSCFVVEPQVFGPGRLIETDGSMVIWITDDARRIPVRSQVKASIGKLDIRIKSLKSGS
jgi:hypothetical protein